MKKKLVEEACTEKGQGSVLETIKKTHPSAYKYFIVLLDGNKLQLGL